MCICFVQQPRLPFSYHCVCVLFCICLFLIVSFLGACGGGGSPATIYDGGFTPRDAAPLAPLSPDNGPVTLAAQMEVGVSHLTFAPSHSLLADAGLVQSSSWGVTGVMPVKDGNVGVGVAQPVTVEAAPFHYRLPVGRSLGGTVHYANRTVDFKAARRELDASLFYRTQVGPLAGEVTLSTEWRANRANMAARDEMLAAVTWRVRL